MKKNIKVIYLIELLLLIFTIMFKVNIFNMTFTTLVTVTDVFMLALAVMTCLILKFPKDKGFTRKAAVRITVVNLLALLIFSYAIGLFTGFNNNVFSLKFINIIKNIVPAIIYCTSIEVIRYVICKNSFFEKKPIIIYTLLIIILNIIIEINTFNFYDGEQIFKFVSTVIIPVISKETVFSYVTYTVGFAPSLIYHLATDCYIYLFPIVPDLGNYLYSVIFLIAPYVYYLSIRRLNTYHDKPNYNTKGLWFYLISIPLLIIALLFLVLDLGITKYQLIAIGSDSMQPSYGRGDGIIFVKKTAEEAKVGEILVFTNDGMTITHRIIKKWKNGDDICFKTKGDNNEKVDDFIVNGDDVYGTAVLVVKYVGYPSIWLFRK